MKRVTRRSSGFTLIELMIATLVFTVTVAGLLQAILGVLYLKETSEGSATAAFHLGCVMERMRATAFNSLSGRFPPNVADGNSANPYASIVGGYTLRNEHITVTYVNPTADPLEITATVRWRDSRNRNYSRAVTTIRTR